MPCIAVIAQAVFIAEGASLGLSVHGAPVDVPDDFIVPLSCVDDHVRAALPCEFQTLVSRIDSNGSVLGLWRIAPPDGPVHHRFPS